MVPKIFKRHFLELKTAAQNLQRKKGLFFLVLNFFHRGATSTLLNNCKKRYMMDYQRPTFYLSYKMLLKMSSTWMSSAPLTVQ